MGISEYVWGICSGTEIQASHQGPECILLDALFQNYQKVQLGIARWLQEDTGRHNRSTSHSTMGQAA